MNKETINGQIITIYTHPLLIDFLKYMNSGLPKVTGLKVRVCKWKLFSYFSTQTYVVGTQKNHLNEMVL